MSSLLILVLLVALAWYWMDSAQAREIAIKAAREACRRDDLQFLDDTVAQRGLRLVRNERGHLVLQRRFVYEYSLHGDDRQSGVVIMEGHSVVRVHQPRVEIWH